MNDYFYKVSMFILNLGQLLLLLTCLSSTSPQVLLNRKSHASRNMVIGQKEEDV
jgi:hypothetical protein